MNSAALHPRPRYRARMIRKLLLSVLLLAACSQSNADSADAAQRHPPRPRNAQTALFAGGCFWSAERDVEAIPGVVDAVSGFAGGTVRNPTYEQVRSEEHTSEL